MRFESFANSERYPTENLVGIIIEGDYEDFYEIVESIHRMTGFEENYDDCCWSIKNRLLGICYDMRHVPKLMYPEEIEW